MHFHPVSEYGWSRYEFTSSPNASHGEFMSRLQFQLFIFSTRLSQSKNFVDISHSPSGALSYLCILLTMRAGDIELNPGPPRYIKFPCRECGKAVRCDYCRPAICCDSCPAWYHKDCIGDDVFDTLSKPDVTWICCSCGVPKSLPSFFYSL